MQPTQPRFHPVPLALAVALALGVPSFAHAQAASASGKVISLSIAAQPLGAALNELSAATGTAIGFPPALVAGKTAHAVKGDLTVRQAVDQLLRGTGLVAVREGDGIVIKAAPPASGDSVGELAAVTVTAQAEHEGTTEGTGSYTQSGPTTTATALSMSLRETPQSISVVTRQKMDDFNLNTLAEVLEQTPGVYVYRQGDAVEFQARGGTINNFQTDGTRSGNNYFSSDAPIQNNFSGDEMADMDRVEILKGSAGLLQGDGQPTATVNMIRKKPTREFQAHIGAGAGSWSTYRTEVDVSGPLNEGGSVRGRLVGSYKDGNSYRDNAGNKYAMIYGVLDIDLTPDTLLTLSADYKQHKNSGGSGFMTYRIYDTQGNYYGLAPRSWNAGAPWSEYTQNSVNAVASLEHRFSNNWKASVKINSEIAKTPDWIFGNVISPDSGANLSRYKDMESKTQGINIDVKGPFSLAGRTHEFVAGLNYSRTHYSMDQWRGPASWRATTLVDYQNSITDTSYLADGGSTYPYPTGEWDIRYLFREATTRRGAYAAGRFSLRDDLKLIVGTRFSDYIYDYTSRNVYQGANDLTGETHYRHKGVITPYAGAVYDLSKTASLYASYTNVFQPTNLQDEQGRVLNPQEGTTYELGAKAEFYEGKLNVAFAHFWKRWDNYYELSGGLTPTGSAAYRNVSGAMERGYELELSGELAPGWQVQGGYVLNNSSIGKSSGNISSPKQQFKLYSTYRLPGKLAGLTVGGGARWQSKIANSTYAKLEQSPYWVFDLMARYRFDRHWSASVNVANVFDKKYFAGVHAMTGWGMYATWGAPRSISANLRYDF